MVGSGRGERTKDDASMMDGWMDDMMIDDGIKKKKNSCACFWLAMFMMRDQLSHSNSGRAIQRFGF